MRRFWQGHDDDAGSLIHRRGMFSYAEGEEDDEPIFKFDRHVITQGESMSITEHDGVTRPFRIVFVR